ncbi:MAG TPA: transcription antitermination factor NusB, partial [Alphaproteobacteria bacterium]
MILSHKENSGVPARIAAAQAVNAVFEHGKSLDEALDQFMGKARLPENDRRLVHAIAGTVFRHLPQIDEALRQVMAQKRNPKPQILHNVLRVGIAQLLYMDVPDHAALNTTVSAAGSLKLDRQKSFINGCLRSVQREKQSLLEQEVTALDRLPDWLRDNWIQHYGESKAKSVAQASLAQAPIDITLNALQAPHKDGQLPQGEPLAPWSIRSVESPSQLTSWPGFKNGKWWVQDLAASIPINILGDIHDKSVLD